MLSVNPALDYSLPYRVLAFYAVTPLDDVDEKVEAHRSFLAEHSMVGRVYVCADGLNAQVSGTAAACAEYRAFAAQELPPTLQLIFKEDPVGEPAFPKLRVKHKQLVPNGPNGQRPDLSMRGEDLSPERWAAMLEEHAVGSESSDAVVLDVRNSYEWDVGRFDGADRPALDNFAEFDASTYGLPTDAEAKKNTPVMMYCTGGIRCEYFSAHLKAEGFEKVYKLQGGVQHYGNTMSQQAVPEPSPAPHWKGSLFVFDRRNTVRFDRSGADAPPMEPIGQCHHCSAPTEAFVNCCNVDCNKLHLVCPRCLTRHKGFCSDPCEGAPRRRPLDLLAATEEDGELDFAKAIAATQGPAPGAKDPNKLVSFKPANIRRSEYDADEHGFEPK